MTDKPKHLVIFQPSGSRGQIEDGTTLLEAARSLGVELESTCGGTMRCSKCRVRIEEGFFERFGIDSSMSHLSPMRDGEREFFISRGIPLDGNFRQSCVTEVHGPAVIFVPEESRAVKQLIRKSARQLNIELKPAVKRYFVTMSKATLHEPMGDWERVCLALKEKYGLENLSIDYRVL
ncbi:MAG: 2Fe-2S iron-sulfur cluster binding domain-containing protein, partial [Chloroflexota bacterium]|nr:2Fe-2S iron-sulfur cluster binding domain-containing protein [Chloroflexota bacterium]